MIGGRDMGKLQEYAQQVMDYLNTVPGVVDADTSLKEGKPQFGVSRPGEMYELGV